MIFIWLIFCYVVIYYVKEYFDRRKSPPGPWPIPILGTLVHISQAAKEPHIALANIAKKYGSEITRHKMGSFETVILSSYESICAVLGHPDALGRPMVGPFYDRSDGKRLGFIMREDKPWIQKRNWTIRTLKDYGFGKSNEMEVVTSEMVNTFLTTVEKVVPSGEGVFNVTSSFTPYVFKIMWKMVAGRCTPQDDIVIARLLEKNERMIQCGTMGSGVLSVFPFVKYIAPEWSGQNIFMDFFTDVRTSARALLRELRSNINSSDGNEKAGNLTESYILQMKENKEDFTEEDYEILFMDIFQGASDTTSSFLEACMLFIILNPEMQTKVYKEILEVIPKGQEPSVSDLKRMTYTQAFFVEVHRCTKVVQLFLLRRVTKDFYYKDYLIKKDTQIITDCHSAFNNDSFGNDPEVFRPERFITEDGELTETHKLVIPFSVGKRNCPGQSLADVTGFLFFVKILKTYELSTVPGKSPPSAEMNVGFTSRPHPFQMWVKKRN